MLKEIIIPDSVKKFAIPGSILKINLEGIAYITNPPDDEESESFETGSETAEERKETTYIIVRQLEKVSRIDPLVLPGNEAESWREIRLYSKEYSCGDLVGYITAT